jgi:hypothetical protein
MNIVTVTSAATAISKEFVIEWMEREHLPLISQKKKTAAETLL